MSRGRTRTRSSRSAAPTAATDRPGTQHASVADAFPVRPRHPRLGYDDPSLIPSHLRGQDGRGYDALCRFRLVVPGEACIHVDIALRYDDERCAVRIGLHDGGPGSDGAIEGHPARTVGHQGLLHDGTGSATGGGVSLVDNRRRVLHTRLGRFTSRDPLNQNQPGGGYQDGMNRYQYVRSNPVTRLDPSGLCEFGQCITPDPADPNYSRCCDGVMYNPSEQCCNQNDDVYGCPEGTCDKWTLSVDTVAAGGVILSGLVIDTVLRASSDCCITPARKQYVFAGFGGGPFADASGAVNVGLDHDFETPCIGYSDHAGFGFAVGVGVGIGVHWSSVGVSTPHTRVTIDGFDTVGFGAGASYVLGRWFFE